MVLRVKPMSSHWPSYIVVNSLVASNRTYPYITPWIIACQSPLPIGLPRQEYWSGLPFPSPGDLPNPGIEPKSPAPGPDGLNNRNLLFRVWSLRSPRSKCRPVHFLGEGSLPGLQTVTTSLCPHRAGREESKLSGVSSYEDTNLIMKVSFMTCVFLECARSGFRCFYACSCMYTCVFSRVWLSATPQL